MTIKKSIALFMAAFMLLALLAACTSKKADPETSSPVVSEKPEVSGDPLESPEISKKPEIDETPVEPSAPSVPSDSDSSVSDMELSDIVDKIYEEKDPGLNLGTMDVDLSDANALQAYTGLSSSDKISEAVASEALIGSQAYSMVLVRVKDIADLETVASDMKSGINQRKWICVEAGDLSVAACGNVVLLIMVDYELADAVTSAEIISAFKTVCGGSLDVESI